MLRFTLCKYLEQLNYCCLGIQYIKFVNYVLERLNIFLTVTDKVTKLYMLLVDIKYCFNTYSIFWTATLPIKGGSPQGVRGELIYNRSIGRVAYTIKRFSLEENAAIFIWNMHSSQGSPIAHQHSISATPCTLKTKPSHHLSSCYLWQRDVQKI